MSKDARQKLRDMGGIMASSPDLIQAVQKFNNGGPIMPMLPRAPSGPNFAPRTPPAPMSGVRPSSLQVPPLAGTLPVVPRELVGDARRRALAGTAPSFGMSTNLGSLEPILEDDITSDDLLSSSLGRTTGPTSRPVVGSKPSSDIVSRQNELRAARGLPPLSPEQVMEFAKSAAAAPLAQDISRAAEIDAELAAIEDRKVGGAYASSADAAKEESLKTERRQLGESAGKTLAAEDTVMAQPLVPKELSQEQIDKAMELVKESPDLSFLNPEGEDTIPAPDGDTTPSPDGDVTPPPGGGDDKPTKRDLRSRYNDQLALMQEIYGLEDKDEAQERAMSLAMIGLAIAAGQSPNALTNIAQGAMVGLNAMGERRDAARERERGIKTLALQTAIDQQAAEAEAEAEAAKMDLEQRNRLELEEYKARVGAMYGGSGGSRDARNIIDFTQNTYTEALKAASAMTAPEDFDPDTETPHQYAMRQAQQAAESMGRMFPGYGGLASPDAPAVPEIPTITTREEYDALPSGTKFMQNGQERIKP